MNRVALPHAREFPAMNQSQRINLEMRRLLDQQQEGQSKPCPHCRTRKPLSAFGMDARYKDQRNSVCLECRAENARIYRQGAVAKEKARRRAKKWRLQRKLALIRALGAVQKPPS